MVSRVHKKHGSKELLQDDESPICTFPPEVLSAIFAAGREIEETSSTDSNPLSREAGLSFELLMSHICSYFRDIAIGTPSLWTSIFIAPTTKPEKVLTYIARSLDCRLDLRVDMSGWASSALGRYAMMEMINFVSAQSHRWRRLSIAAAGESEDNSIVMMLCSRGAPALEYLSMSLAFSLKVHRGCRSCVFGVLRYTYSDHRCWSLQHSILTRQKHFPCGSPCFVT